MLETIKENAIVIEAVAAIVSAVAVLLSTWFIIWTTYFRKTRRDRIDELKEEIQVSLSDDWTDKIIARESTVDDFFQILKPKFQKTKYKVLHQSAYDELGFEGKNKTVNRSKKREEDRRYRRESQREERRDSHARRR